MKINNQEILKFINQKINGNDWLIFDSNASLNDYFYEHYHHLLNEKLTNKLKTWQRFNYFKDDLDIYTTLMYYDENTNKANILDLRSFEETIPFLIQSRKEINSTLNQNKEKLPEYITKYPSLLSVIGYDSNNDLLLGELKQYLLQKKNFYDPMKINDVLKKNVSWNYHDQKEINEYFVITNILEKYKDFENQVIIIKNNTFYAFDYQEIKRNNTQNYHR